jgi:NADH-quinone oxidoreductase subunit D
MPQIRDLLVLLPKRLQDLEDLLNENYIWKARTVGVGYLDLAGCMALGITGPVLRSTGLPHDLRRAQPYCGYETYDFDVITDDALRFLAATSFGSRRCASRSRSSNSACSD